MEAPSSLIATVTKWLDGGCNSWDLPSGEIRKLCAAIESLSAQCAQPQAGEPVADEREWCKLYHSRWPTEDLLKAREPGGLITDDGEAWKYHYTHSDAQGGPYDLVYRPVTSAQPANPAQVTDAMVKEIRAIFERMCGAGFAPTSYDIRQALPALTAAIGVGGQAVAELRQIEEMLDAGQGDDDGAQILPEFRPGMSIVAKVEACLHSLEDNRDLIEALSQPHPADERVVEALVDRVLDAAGLYMGEQYGNTALHHPTDRARIKAALAKEGRKNG